MTHLQVSVNDIPGMEVFHSKRHLMDQSDLLAPFPVGGLQIVDDIAISHYLLVE
jgi:hypothetical protein